uniref:Uncharacterized protein n=1 Tax=Acrobeloides nanus TaxID=290746 RepID=A0A914EIT5_9BILA
MVCTAESPWKDFIEDARYKHPLAKGKDLFGYIINEMTENMDNLANGILLANETYLTLASNGAGSAIQFSDAMDNLDKFSEKCGGVLGCLNMGYLKRPFNKKYSKSKSRLWRNKNFALSDLDCMEDAKWARIIDSAVKQSPKTMAAFIHDLKNGTKETFEAQIVVAYSIFGKNQFMFNLAWDIEGEGTYDDWSKYDHRLKYCNTFGKFIGFYASLTLGVIEKK